jgi:hypothetical protein
MNYEKERNNLAKIGNYKKGLDDTIGANFDIFYDLSDRNREMLTCISGACVLGTMTGLDGVYDILNDSFFVDYEKELNEFFVFLAELYTDMDLVL